MNSILKNLIGRFPTIIQYIIVVGLILLLVYLALLFTRKVGEKRGEKVTFDDPEAYDKTIPDPLAKRKTKKKKADDSSAKVDSDNN